MADDSIFNALVKVVDEATIPLKALAAEVRQVAGVEHAAHKEGVADAHEHGRAFAALTAHVRLLRGHMLNLSGSVGEFGRSITEFLPMIAGIGAAGSLAGLFEMTEHASEAFSELNKSAQAAGVTATQFSELAMAAKMTDVPVDTMSTGLFRLNNIIGQTVGGQNKNAAALFHQLGINLKDANGHTRDAASLMPQLADAFAHTHSAAMRDRMAMVLFGRAGKDLVPLLSQGAAALREYAAASDAVDYVPKGAEAKGLEEFHQAWISLTSAVGGFTSEIGAKLAPVLKPVIDMAKEWIVANRDWIATDIAHAVGELAHWLQDLKMKDIIKETKGWIETIQHVVKELGGFHRVLTAGVIVALGAPLLGGLAIAGGAFSALLGIVGSLTAVLLANPIVAFAAVAGGAAYELYKHWDWVKQQMAVVFNWFSHQGPAFQALLAMIMPIVGVPMLIIEHWKPITAFFANLWSGITAAFRAAMADIKPVVDWISGAIHTVENSWIGRQLAGPAAAGQSQHAADYRRTRTGGPQMLPPSPSLRTGGPQPLPPSPSFADQSPPTADQSQHAADYRRMRTGHHLPLPPSPYAPGSPSAVAAAAAGAPGAPGASGQVAVKVDISGAPPGTRTQTRSSGAAVVAQTNVGYADPLALAY